MKTFASVHPYDQRLLSEYPIMEENAIEKSLQEAARAFEDWQLTSFDTRSHLFENLAQVLLREKESFAQLISLEMGKVLAESRVEIEKCATGCLYYAQHGAAFLRDEPVETRATRSLVVYQPIGAVLGIMPWNFPFWQVLRFALPTIMAGNVALLKHAPNVTGCSLAIEKAFWEAGFPERVFQSLVMGTELTEKVISHDIVQGVTLTGSEYAGSSVAALAGKHIKKTVMELGGSDPLIVLEDADLDMAATSAVQSRMRNAGQSCIAAKRFLVMKPVAEAFLEKVARQIRELRQGDPLSEDTTIGPLARLDLAQKLEKQWQSSVKSGASLLLGGEREGANVQPVLLSNTPADSPAFMEETFGPLAAVVSVDTEKQAIALANQSRYGLGAAIWTRDLEKGEHLGRQLRCGSVFVNTLVRSMPEMPFGGIKKSGYGRELAHHGMREFVNIKSLFISQEGMI